MTDQITLILYFSAAALFVEICNSIGIAYGIRWMLTAGANVVNSISQKLGLQRGKNGSILDQIKALIPQKGETSEGGDETPIDLGEFGSYTPSQIKSFAANLGSQVKAGKAKLPVGGEMDVLQRLMSGKNVGWEEATPFIMEFLRGGGNNGSATTSHAANEGHAWSS